MKKLALAVATTLVLLLPASASAAPIDGHVHSSSFHHNIDWD